MMSSVKYHYDQFPPASLDWEKLVPYIGPANAAIARYDGLLEAIPNAAVLLSPLTTQEAVLSSRIEGTQATIGEVLEFEAGQLPVGSSETKQNDIQEILNYRKAMNHAMHLLDTLPISQRLIKETHRVLMDSVRGHNKTPGEYRKIPNWIGPQGCTIEEARFIPISADKLSNGMSAFERFIHSENVTDKLTQLAILHAEFEALHPFLDGNGRLGRMLIPLFLWNSGILRSPMFYISAYFDAHRNSYYDNLLLVSKNKDWTGWIIFFLKALKEQADQNSIRASKILHLYNSKKNELVQLTHSQYTIRALDWIFEKPIFKSSDFVDNAGIPSATARRIISVFKKDGILRTLKEASGRKPAVYAFRELLNIAEGHDVF
jgi:Fic family protein